MAPMYYRNAAVFFPASLSKGKSKAGGLSQKRAPPPGLGRARPRSKLARRFPLCS